jgi:hypothetical protein
MSCGLFEGLRLEPIVAIIGRLVTPRNGVHNHRRHFMVARVRTLFDGSKCFLFNGRQYYE